MAGSHRQDAILQLISTREGAKVCCHCVAYGSAKQRKNILKLLKSHVVTTACHPFGYLVLMRILDVVDDTVLVAKSVLAELTQSTGYW